MSDFFVHPESYALMASVPAKRIGWVCECGQVLDKDLNCPDCGRRFEMCDNFVTNREGYYLSRTMPTLFSERRAA